MHAPPPANADLPTAPGSHRLFFALWPDDATRIAIASVAAQLRTHARGGRWTAADRFHLTLPFLGTYRHLPTALVDSALAAAADVRTPGFAIALDRVGSFRTRSHLWWLGCEAGPLLPLYSLLAHAMAGFDVPCPPATFVPHVTIVRGAARPPPPDVTVPPVVWPVNSFALIHSESGARNAYHVVGQWPLEAA